MEYRRRKKRRAGSAGAGSGALGSLLTILLFAAAAYLIIFAGAGRRIAQGAKKLSSLVFPRETAYPTPLFLETRAPEETEKSAVSPAPASETRKVTLPGISVYMLSIGSFSDRASAEAAAEELKAKGAAGCVREAEGGYTVIAAAYSDEGDAQSVKARLESEGYSCSLTSLVKEGCELEVTASPERLLPIGTAFAIAPETVVQLDELSRALDSEAKSTEYGEGVLYEIKRNLVSAREGLGVTEGGDIRLQSLGEYLDRMCSLIDSALRISGQRAEFSSAIKELRLEAALGYAELLSRSCD